MIGTGEAHKHWYEITDKGDLRQGDVFRQLLVFMIPPDVPVYEADPADARVQIPVGWHRGDWIVMSASCDLDRPETYPQVLLGRVLTAERALPETTAKNEEELRKTLEVARRGQDPARFILPEHPAVTPPFPCSFVQAKVHVTSPIEYLLKACGKPRLRLKHPFRESFASWVGANISRVGPETHTLIPKFIKNLYPGHVLKATDE